MKSTTTKLLDKIYLHVGPPHPRTGAAWYQQIKITRAALRNLKITMDDHEGCVLADVMTYASETWPHMEPSIQGLYAIEKITDTANEEHRARRSTGDTLHTLRIMLEIQARRKEWNLGP